MVRANCRRAAGPVVIRRLGGLMATILMAQVALGGTADEPPAIQFLNVAPRSEIQYTSNNDFTGRKYFPQPMCGGVAILDFDLDGKQDIFFTNGAKLPELVKSDPSFYNCLLRNLGDGRFQDVTRQAGVEGAQIGFLFWSCRRRLRQRRRHRSFHLQRRSERALPKQR